MSEIQVTQIDVNYAQTLSALGRRLFADTFSSDNTPENIEAYLDESYKPEIQEKELNDPTMYTYMAFDENKLPVGFAQLRIGSKLMAACLAKAKELNKKTMWLGVWEFNPNAIKFYTNKGFKKVGSHVFKMGEQEDTDYIMILKL
ncbi:hypothetical protein PS6_000387 [Mucor atramentarius]